MGKSGDTILIIDESRGAWYAWGMARLARLVIPGMPHHVTQRGNRRQETFFNEGDYAAYLELMVEWCREEGVEVWGYCLMPNHTHLIAVPASEQSLRRAIGEAHRRYTRRINFREKWRGYLWQGRFASFVMDEPYLLAAARYVELNPLRARLVGSAAEWPWSSARGTSGGVTTRWSRSARCWRWLAIGRDCSTVLCGKRNWQSCVGTAEQGVRWGTRLFLERLEDMVGRVLRPQKAGRKPKLRRLRK